MSCACGKTVKKQPVKPVTKKTSTVKPIRRIIKRPAR